MSSFLTLDEYLKLVDEQYGSSDELLDSNFDSGMIHRTKNKNPNRNHDITSDKVIDLTDCKRSQLGKQVVAGHSFQVGKFLIKKSGDGFYIYEYKKLPNSGHEFPHKIDVNKDSRFKQCMWTKHFDQMKKGKNVSLDIQIEIIGWLQAIDKYTILT